MPIPATARASAVRLVLVLLALAAVAPAAVARPTRIATLPKGASADPEGGYLVVGAGRTASCTDATIRITRLGSLRRSTWCLGGEYADVDGYAADGVRFTSMTYSAGNWVEQEVDSGALPGARAAGWGAQALYEWDFYTSGNDRYVDPRGEDGISTVVHETRVEIDDPDCDPEDYCEGDIVTQAELAVLTPSTTRTVPLDEGAGIVAIGGGRVLLRQADGSLRRIVARSGAVSALALAPAPPEGARLISRRRAITAVSARQLDVYDPATGARTATYALPAGTKAGAADVRGTRAYVVVGRTIAVIDLATGATRRLAPRVELGRVEQLRATDAGLVWVARKRPGVNRGVWLERWGAIR